jgi:hypothetical protein
VHPRFFIEPSTLNHFTPFRRFEKFGYSHLSAASFQPNGIADFEHHGPFPPVAARDARFASCLLWPPSPSEITCHRSRGCIKAGAEIFKRLLTNSAAGLIRQYARWSPPTSVGWAKLRAPEHLAHLRPWHSAVSRTTRLDGSRGMGSAPRFRGRSAAYSLRSRSLRLSVGQRRQPHNPANSLSCGHPGR